jgi:glycosyltransferase involved in cell wall biosynthesis
MKKILILTYWSYKDALIQTYTLPYIRIIRKIIPAGSRIFLVTFESKFHALSAAERTIIKQDLANEGISWMPHSYLRFGLVSFLKNIFSIAGLYHFCVTKRITHIHAWCTPAGCLGYVLSKLSGTPLILDSFEPHAEAMLENGSWKKTSLAFQLLFFFEKQMAKKAGAVIAVSAGMREYAAQKYHTQLISFFVKPACVDLTAFDPASILTTRESHAIVCVYAGKFGGIYLDQEVFHFLKVAHDYWGTRFRVLLLTDTPQNKIEEYAKRSDLNSQIITSRYAAYKDIPAYLAQADFALNPVKPVPTKRYCTSIKDGEYWAMGLPVVITRNISDDSEIIEQNNMGAVLAGFDNESYLDAVKKIDLLLQSPSLKKKKEEIREIAITHRGFEIAEKIYRDIYGTNVQTFPVNPPAIS